MPMELRSKIRTRFARGVFSLGGRLPRLATTWALRLQGYARKMDPSLEDAGADIADLIDPPSGRRFVEDVEDRVQEIQRSAVPAAGGHLRGLL